jgi:phenylalanyl-tRNA synthetase beta chain
MTENYEFVRNSILPLLLESESISAHAVYPHNIFEVGKIAFLDESDNYGSVSRNALGFMSAHRDAGFNEVNSQVSALLFYLGKDYENRELEDPRFIPGRGAAVFIGGVRVGVFGEVHPTVLENWGITMPTTLAEFDLDLVMGNT